MDLCCGCTIPTLRESPGPEEYYHIREVNYLDHKVILNNSKSLKSEEEGTHALGTLNFFIHNTLFFIHASFIILRKIASPPPIMILLSFMTKIQNPQVKNPFRSK